jgi:hypothetical protein
MRAPTGYLNVRYMEKGREVRTVEVDSERGPLMPGHSRRTRPATGRFAACSVR